MLSQVIAGSASHALPDKLLLQSDWQLLQGRASQAGSAQSKRTRLSPVQTLGRGLPSQCWRRSTADPWPATRATP